MGVTQLIWKVTTLLVTLSILVCLLGLVEGLAIMVAHRTLLRVLLFYARKAIVLHWRKTHTPNPAVLERTGELCFTIL